MSETESEPIFWYALYTKPRAEKSFAKLCKKYKIEAFLPLVPTKRKWSDRWKVVDLPLFPSYIFLKVPFWKEKKKVLQLPGSHHFVFLKGVPAVIPEEDILTLRRMIEGLPDKIKVQKEEAIQPGKKVKILSGPFKDHIAEIIKQQTKVHVLVRLPMLNQVASVEVHIDDLSWEEI